MLIVQDRPVKLTKTFTDQLTGETLAADSVSVVVRDFKGDLVDAAAAGQDGDVWSFSLTATDVTSLRVEWLADVGGVTHKIVDSVDVMSRRIVDISDLYAFEPSLKTSGPAPERTVKAADRAEDHFLDVGEQAWARRYQTQAHKIRDSRWFRLCHDQPLHALLGVQSGGEWLSLSDFEIFDQFVEYTGADPLTKGKDIVFHFVAGHDSPPADVADVFLIAVRVFAADTADPQNARMRSTVSERGEYTVDKAGVDNLYSTGLDAVDEVLARYRTLRAFA